LIICAAGLKSFVMSKCVRQIITALVVLSSFTHPALALDREPIYGKWGTEAQCSGALIIEKGTKHANPFDIRADWLERGDVWCRLDWVFSDSTPGGIFAIAKALCGEDSAREYQINFNLNGDELILVWDEQFENGPLKRCT